MRFSIKKRLHIWSIILPVIFLFVQMLGSNFSFISLVENVTLDLDVEILKSTSENLDNQLFEMQKFAVDIASNYQIKELFCIINESKGDYDYINAWNTIKALISTFEISYKNKYAVSINFANNEWIHRDALQQMDLLEESLQKIGNFEEISAVEEIKLQDNTLLVCRVPVKNNDLLLGEIFVIALPAMYKILLDEKREIDIVNPSNNQVIYKKNGENIDEIYVPYQAPNSNYELRLYKNNNQYVNPPWHIIGLSFVSFIICLCISIIMSRYTIHNVLQPIDLLVDMLSNTDVTSNKKRSKITYTHKRFTDTLISYFILVLILPMVFMLLLSLGSTYLIMKNSVIHTLSRNFDNASFSVSQAFDENQTYIKMLSVNTDIQKLLMNYESDKAVDYDGIYAMMRFSQKNYAQNYNLDMSLYDTMGESIFDFTGKKTKLDLTSEIIKNLLYETITYEKEGITIYRRVRNIIGGAYNTLGYIKCFIPFSFLNLSQDSLLDGNTSVIKLEQSEILMPHNRSVSNELQMKILQNPTESIDYFENNNGYYIYSPLKIAGWGLIGVFDFSTVIHSNFNVFIVNIVIMLLSLSIALMIAYKLSSYLSRSMEILQYNLMNTIDNGKQSPLREGIEDNEVAYIALTIEKFIEKIEGLAKENFKARINEAEMEVSQKQAEILALQTQINPHFLYNTLEVLKYMMREQRTDVAVDMVDMLSDIFRSVSNYNVVKIPLSEELKNINVYIELQQICLEERLHVSINIHSDVMKCMIPKFILQPIIENAIMHGMDDVDKTLYIKIYGFIDENKLYIQVKNDGISINSEKLQQIREMLKVNTNTNSIGLINVHKRIVLYYGKEYGITIENNQEDGICVTLRMPL